MIFGVFGFLLLNTITNFKIKPSQLHRRLSIFLLASALFATITHGQETIVDENNTVIRSLTERVVPSGWLFFSPSSEVEPGDLFTVLKPHTGLGPDDEMTLIKEWSDNHGYGHKRYQQYHKGLLVEKARWTEHFRECDSLVEFTSGKIIENFTINEVSTITEAEALDSALADIGAIEYAWNNQEWEDSLKVDLEDPNATYYPEGELLLGLVAGLEVKRENYRVAWKFIIESSDPYQVSEVYVDAHTGDVLRNSESGNNGTATIHFHSNTVNIDTRKPWPHTKWYLKADNNPDRKIHTKEVLTPISWLTANRVKDDDDLWDSPSHIDAVSAHHAIIRAWDYFKNVHGRTGFDDNGIKVRVWAGTNLANTRFKPGKAGRFDYIEFGTTLGGQAGTSFASVDFGGHEFTHGVIWHMVGSMRFGERGALNESFSDIFGYLIVKRFIGPTFSDHWLMGINQGGPTVGIRSLKNPSSNLISFPDRALSGSPETYQGTGWYFGAFDQGGIHVNCSVQNYMFHLLVEGSNSLPLNGVVVDGLNNGGSDISEAEEIAWYALANLFDEGHGFPDSREAWTKAAGILFGDCSFQHLQTMAAWAAVGIGNVDCLELYGPTIACFNQPPISFFANSLPGSSFTWTVPFGWAAQTAGADNSILHVSSFGPPPPSFPHFETVSVSNGSITKDIEVELILNSFCDEEFTPPCPPGTPPSGVFGYDDNDLIFEQNYLFKEDIQLFPNPAKEYIVVKNHQLPDKEKEYFIYDSKGTMIENFKSSENEFRVNTNQYNSGLYYLRIISEDESYSKSFIISQ